MVKIYTVTQDFWHKGNLVAKGDRIGLKAAEVKYLGHVVTLDTPKAEEPKEEVKVEEPAPTRRKRGEDV